jgi:glycine/betaine/sarcosine/D-proline reductase family selenoprotein B
MTTLAKQMKSNRIVAGTKIPHPCGDPNLPAEADQSLRRKIVTTALNALQSAVSSPTILVPEISYTSG